MEPQVQPNEIARLHCPFCGEEVDAVRPLSDDSVWWLIFGRWALICWLFDRFRPWYCRKCGRAIPATKAEEDRRRTYNWVVAVLVIFLILLFALVVVLPVARN